MIAVASAEPDKFSEEYLRFLEATSMWAGMVADRVELAEQTRRETAEELVRVIAPIKARIEMIRRDAARQG